MVSKRISYMGALLLAPLLLVGWGAAPFPAASCQQCHKDKSMAYQHCRTISPSDREARSRCFAKADRRLKQCLKGCK